MLYTMTMSGTYSLGKMAKGLYTKYTIYVYIYIYYEYIGDADLSV